MLTNEYICAIIFQKTKEKEMALVTCPHCGKNVSDSVEICIHCGGSLKENPTPEKEREYAALPIEEQKSLRKEYDSNCPELCKSEKMNNIAAFLYLISFLLVFIGAVLFGVLAAMDFITGAFICAGIFFMGFAGTWIAYFCSKSFNKRYLTSLKRFQKWLEREKGVHYSATLDEKDRKFFDQVSVD